MPPMMGYVPNFSEYKTLKSRQQPRIGLVQQQKGLRFRTQIPVLLLKMYVLEQIALENTYTTEMLSDSSRPISMSRMVRDHPRY